MTVSATLQVLALETSSTGGSVALLDNDRVLLESPLQPGQRIAQSLAPTVDDILRKVGWRPGDIGLIAVTQGPGSFTGLRVGVTFAKTLAYAARAEAIGVNTLEAIAAQVPAAAPDAGPEFIAAVIDAQRQQLFEAAFRRGNNGELENTRESNIVDNDRWLDELPRPITVTGPGLRKLFDKLSARTGVTVVDQQYWTPRAATVGQIGFRHYRSGRRDDFWKLSPLYYRKSAAEEKRDQSDQSSAN